MASVPSVRSKNLNCATRITDGRRLWKCAESSGLLVEETAKIIPPAEVGVRGRESPLESTTPTTAQVRAAESRGRRPLRP
jgi:hypothetical protein